METNKDIQTKINTTMRAFDVIEEVNVSPFFKDQTMKRLFEERKEDIAIWSWFTPKLQLATLMCLVFLNVWAYKTYNSNTYHSNLNEFAESYGLTVSETDTSLFK